MTSITLRLNPSVNSKGGGQNFEVTGLGCYYKKDGTYSVLFNCLKEIGDGRYSVNFIGGERRSFDFKKHGHNCGTVTNLERD